MSSAGATWRILVAAGSLLLLGAAAGVAADRAVHMHRAPHVIDLTEVHTNPIGVIERVIELRPQQRARIEAILAARQGNMDAAWHQARAHMQALVDSVVAEIQAELDPEQVARFQELVVQIHGQGTFPPPPISHR